jgi:drug/metabolite transporter (DMT)-like permease
MATRTLPPQRAVTLAAVQSVNWLAWGSTFLAGRIAVESAPPMLIAASRSLVAGMVLGGFSLFFSRRRRPATANLGVRWALAIPTGALLFVGGQGLLAIGLISVPSGVAALMQSTIPIWVVLFSWLLDHAERPSGREIVGLLLGILGMAVLVDPRGWIGTGHPVDRLGALMVLLAAISWSLGTTITRATSLVITPMRSTAMQLVSGGALAGLIALAVGDWQRLPAISLRSVGALAYLTVVGSLIGLAAYSWLLGRTSPTRAATYAYVTPLIAVLLGWALAGEELSGRIALAAVVTILGVVLVVAPRRPG